MKGKPINQLNAKLRVCASCEKVFWDKENGCPICGFAHYGAVWALGWWRVIIHWITRFHRDVPDKNRVDKERRLE